MARLKDSKHWTKPGMGGRGRGKKKKKFPVPLYRTIFLKFSHNLMYMGSTQETKLGVLGDPGQPGQHSKTYSGNKQKIKIKKKIM